MKKTLATIILTETEQGHATIKISDKFEALVLRKACVQIVEKISRKLDNKEIPEIDEAKELRFQIETILKEKELTKEDQVQFLKDFLGLLKGQ